MDFTAQGCQLKWVEFCNIRSLRSTIYSLVLQAASDKIVREMEMFGENFERYQFDTTDEKDDSRSVTTHGAPEKAKKSKVAAKSTGHTYQFQIMEAIGVPRMEIKKFADPLYWLEYFPPIAQVGFSPSQLTILVFIQMLARP